uniref:Uncharacterized protein n=1 Tax=Aegilops tauschii subsp. strangulata TaxID=200361 RepID=A0A453I3P4_AEGTS
SHSHSRSNHGEAVFVRVDATRLPLQHLARGQPHARRSPPRRRPHSTQSSRHDRNIGLSYASE